nr:hypothetical protein [Tanacetum cinerariifolium]
MTPTLNVASPQGEKRKQSARETSSPRKSLKVTIRQKKQSTTPIPPPSDARERDKIVEVTLLSLTFQKPQPESHKENLKVIDDDDKVEKKDEDDKKDDDVEKTNDAVKEKDNDDHTLVVTHATVLDHCNNVVPKMLFAKTNEMIKEEILRLVNLAVNKDQEIISINVPELISKEFSTHGQKMIEELFRKHMQITTRNPYPTTSLSTADISTDALQHQLYLNMKSKPQD